MNILHFSDYYPDCHAVWGGAEQGCRRIIELEKKAGHRVHLATTKTLRPPREEGLACYEVPCWEQYFNRRIIWRYQRLKDYFFPFDFIALGKVLWLILKIRPDVIHLHKVNSISFAPVLVGRLLGIPVLLSIYDYWCICPGIVLLKDGAAVCTHYHGPQCITCLQSPGATAAEKWLLRLRRKVFDFFLRRVARFHVLSQASKKLLAAYGIPENKIWVIPLPIKGLYADPGAATPERHGLLFVGAISPHKGTHIALRALAQVCELFPDARLTIIGPSSDPDYMRSLEALIARHGLQGKVDFKGKLPFDQVSAYLKKAEAILIAEQWHNMAPVILVEAMFFGTLVIAGELGGIPEYVVHRKTGLLAKADDPGSYAEAIRWAFLHPQEARRLAEAARRNISELTDEAATCARINELCRPGSPEERDL